MTKQASKNLRFWAFVNDGPVKLTLAPGQCLSHYCGGPTEEGYSREWTEWEYLDDEDGPYIERRNSWDARDCDGRASGGCDCYATPETLAVRVPWEVDNWLGGEGEGELSYPEMWREWCAGPVDKMPYCLRNLRGVLYPEWEQTRRSCRDYAAEAMGY